MIVIRAEPGDPRRPIAHKYGLVERGRRIVAPKPLRNIEPGHRVFAYVSGAGYVSIGPITAKVRHDLPPQRPQAAAVELHSERDTLAQSNSQSATNTEAEPQKSTT